MKILKIEKEKGYFCSGETSEWKPVDEINKNDLMLMLDKVVGGDVVMESPDEVTISNQAHAIIYKSIFEKLTSLTEEKSRFKDESERLYIDEYRRYKELQESGEQ